MVKKAPESTDPLARGLFVLFLQGSFGRFEAHSGEGEKDRQQQQVGDDQPRAPPMLAVSARSLITGISIIIRTPKPTASAIKAVSPARKSRRKV